MNIELPFGSETRRVRIDLPDAQVVVARSKNPSTDRTWAEVVRGVLPSPIGAAPIRAQSLRGKHVAVITDDWARPTPAYEVMPLLLEELHAAGAEDEGITFLTASGMHNPLSRADLARKLGEEIAARYRCVSHDGGDWENLAYCGVTAQGTPIWINRWVAEADYKLALGRIYLHEAYGYEGGYKMILPGVAGFDTITRDHSFNFSPDCRPGRHDNPSRREADAVGRAVGIHFLVNVVVNGKGQPIAAFCGEPETVHRLGREYGDREVWGAPTGPPAEVVLASPGSGVAPRPGGDPEALFRAALAAKENGTIVGLAAQEGAFAPSEGTARAEESLASLDQERFQAALPALATGELLKLHEKRNWPLSEREVQWRIKSVRGEYYRRRRNWEIARRRVVLTSDPDAALRRVLAGLGPEARVVVLPEARATLPLVE